jgi:hypothetical protein
VQVEVRDRLPAGGAVGLQDGEALGLEHLREGPGDPGHRLEGRGSQVGAQVHDGFEVRPDGHNHVTRVHLPDIHERESQLVVVDAMRRDLASSDLAEHTAASHAVGIQQEA